MITVMKMKLGSLVGSLVCILAVSASIAVAAPDGVDRGSTFSGTIRAKFPGENTTMKGIVVALGSETNAFM